MQIRKKKCRRSIVGPLRPHRRRLITRRFLLMTTGHKNKLIKTHQNHKRQTAKQTFCQWPKCCRSDDQWSRLRTVISYAPLLAIHMISYAHVHLVQTKIFGIYLHTGRWSKLSIPYENFRILYF